MRASGLPVLIWNWAVLKSNSSIPLLSPPIFSSADFLYIFFSSTALSSMSSATPEVAHTVSDLSGDKLEKKESIGGNAPHTTVRAEDVAQQIGDGVEASYEAKSRLVNACFQHE
jgi:hypothetical protein